MRIGVSFPLMRPGPQAQSPFLDAIRRIEDAGLSGVWAFDAVARGFFLPDPLGACVAAATATERLEVGTCVLQVAPRNIVDLAHRILTATSLCGGRLALGVGAGSTPDDFEAFGVPFAGRLGRFSRSLPTLAALCRGEEVDSVRLAGPTPAPPILIGSWASRSWIERAARDYDGWIASAAKTSFSALASGIATFRAAGGGRAVVANVAIDLAAETGGMGDDEPFHLRCAPAEAGRRLARLTDLGFDDVVFFLADHSEPSLAAIASLS